jgi:hypothetical protein
MTFENIHASTNCNCLEDCISISPSYYGLKTNKPQLREVDFKSKFQKAEERGESLELENCNDICSHKGLSCSVISEDNREKIIAIYNQLFPSTPKYKPFLNIIKFETDAGVMKFTPLENNPHHHDFYKCDAFSLERVTVVDTISLAI